MTALTTEARGLLVTALSGNGYRVYSTPPAVPTTPSVTIVPLSPWLTPSTTGSKLNYRVSWKIIVAISPRKNDAASLDTEDAVDVILGALPAEAILTDVSAPSLTDIGAQGVIITTEINVYLLMKESP